LQVWLGGTTRSDANSWDARSSQEVGRIIISSSEVVSFPRREN